MCPPNSLNTYSKRISESSSVSTPSVTLTATDSPLLYWTAFLLPLSVLVSCEVPLFTSCFTVFFVYVLVPIADFYTGQAAVDEASDKRQLSQQHKRSNINLQHIHQQPRESGNNSALHLVSANSSSNLFDHHHHHHHHHHQHQHPRSPSSDFHYRFTLYLWIPIQLFVYLWCLIRLCPQSLFRTWISPLHTSYPTWTSIGQFVGIALSMGYVTGNGINVSHELFHKISKWEKFMASLLLAGACYGHFAIEHSYGHHKHVATLHDPATARLNQSFYSFLPQSVFGGLQSAWAHEIRRLHAKHLPWYCSNNRFWTYMLLSSLLFSASYLVGGSHALLFFIIQSVVAVVVLEKANYIEHYGLLRKMRLPLHTQARATAVDASKPWHNNNPEDSILLYEDIGPQHSWDAPDRFSNYMLFKLQRHADHHLHCMKPYQTLQIQQDSPKLPIGYAGLGIILLIPPLWRYVMNHRVPNH